jgi:hypothetical protein
MIWRERKSKLGTTGHRARGGEMIDTQIAVNFDTYDHAQLMAAVRQSS